MPGPRAASAIGPRRRVSFPDAATCPDSRFATPSDALHVLDSPTPGSRFAPARTGTADTARERLRHGLRAGRRDVVAPSTDGATVTANERIDPGTNSGAALEPAAGEAIGTDVGREGESGTDTAKTDEGVTPEPVTTTTPATPAEPPAEPLACDAPTAALQTRALELINAVRETGHDCGAAGVFAPAAPLGWDSRLEAAARVHSADMARTGNFDHTGTDGSSAGDRIEREGYAWGRWAENIAAGQGTLEAAVEGWLASPGHCRNLLAPNVRDTALVCVTNEDARYRHYWTQVFARPLETRRRP